MKLSPIPSKESIPYRVDLIADNGTSVRIDYIDMKVVQRGSKELTLSNGHQNTPFHFKWMQRIQDGFCKLSAKISLEGLELELEEQRQALQAQNAFATAGTIRIVPLDKSKSLPILETKYAGDPTQSPDVELVAIIDKLCFIQDRTKCKLHLPDRAIHMDEIRAIDTVVTILETGKIIRKNGSIKLSLQGTSNLENAEEMLRQLLETHRKRELAKMTIEAPERIEEIFGVKIPLGSSVIYIAGHLAPAAMKKLARLTGIICSEATLRIDVVNAEIIEDYPNWSQ